MSVAEQKTYELKVGDLTIELDAEEHELYLKNEESRRRSEAIQTIIQKLDQKADKVLAIMADCSSGESIDAYGLYSKLSKGMPKGYYNETATRSREEQFTSLAVRYFTALALASNGFVRSGDGSVDKAKRTKMIERASATLGIGTKFASGNSKYANGIAKMRAMMVGNLH